MDRTRRILCGTMSREVVIFLLILTNGSTQTTDQPRQCKYLVELEIHVGTLCFCLQLNQDQDWQELTTKYLTTTFLCFFYTHHQFQFKIGDNTQVGSFFDTILQCFMEAQFYFTTIYIPCDFDKILTSFEQKSKSCQRNWTRRSWLVGLGLFVLSDWSWLAPAVYSC